MKVALIGSYPATGALPRGGVETVLSKLVDWLVRHGVQCHVLAPYSARDEIECVSSSLTIHRIRKSRLPGAIEFCTVLPWRIRQVLLKIDPDIVHVHGAAVWTLAFRSRSVLTVHGAAEREIAHRNPRLGRLLAPLVGAIEDSCATRIHYRILINPYSAELRRIGQGARVWNVANPIDPMFFDSPPKVSRQGNGERDVLWIGSTAVLKNLFGLIEIARAMVRTGLPIRMHVYGVKENDSGAYLRKCRAEIDRLRLSAHFVFHGHQPSRVIREHMDRAVALVITSLQETAPCIVSEALSRGLYVIAPNSFGLPHMIPDREIGWLYSLKQAPALWVGPVLAHLIERKTDSSARAQEIARIYHPDQVGRATLAVYETIRQENKHAIGRGLRRENGEKKRSGLLIVGTRPPPIGGVTMHVGRLCEWLTAGGHRFTQCNPRTQGIGVVLHTIARHRLCHIHLSNPIATFALVVWARLVGCMSIVTVHGDFERFSGVKQLFRRLSTRWTNVPIVLNANAKRAASLINDRTCEMSAYIPPVTEEMLEPMLETLVASRVEGRARIVITNAFDYVLDANGREIYGVFELVDWLADRNTLLVVSDPSGNYQKAAIARYRDEQLSHVLFISVPHSFVAALRFADVFIRNTVTDGDSLSIHEALSAKKTVWATPVVARPRGVRVYTSLGEIDLYAAYDDTYRAPKVVDELLALYSDLLKPRRP